MKLPQVTQSVAGVLGAVALAVSAGAFEIASPDGNLVFRLNLDEQGSPSYTLERGGAPVLAQSKLGVVLETADLTRGLRIDSTTGPARFEDAYANPTGKRLQVRHVSNRGTVRLAGSEGARLEVEICVADDGAAFRYHLPMPEGLEVEVLSEATSFHLPEGSRSWLQAMSVAKSGWARTNPSYEEYYERDVPVGAPSALGAGWVFPALFRTGDTWLAVTETGLRRGHCASRLAHLSEAGEYRIDYPDTRETIGNAPVRPRLKLPASLPWRVLAAGSLTTLVESTLGTDLADPAIHGVVPVGPTGLASWSWPRLGDGATVFAVQKRYIDFAADMGWPYCLIDALWDTQISEAELRDLLAHAAARGVKVLLWYNSNGDWNDAFQTPKHRMLTRESRKAEFARLRELGVAGIKVDFFGGDGRAVIEQYIDILEDSAEFGLLINFHGATLCRGWQRTYPHLMTVEAVRGFEFITFGQGDADRAATHMAMLPFARNLFDPMDFTPVCLTEIRKIQRRTSPGFELATAVLYLSGIQHIVETPEGVAAQPEYVRDYLRSLPGSWEETRFLEGEPGKFVAIARRAPDGAWHIGGINATRGEHEFNLSLARLGSVSRALVIEDGDGEGFRRAEVSLKEEGGGSRELRVKVGACRGFVAVVR